MYKLLLIFITLLVITKNCLAQNVKQSFNTGRSNISTATNIGGIINSYTPVLAFEPCTNKLTVENGSSFNTGDTVLLIQMKGAGIDSTNTAAFGTIIDYKKAGNYEINYVKSRTGNVIELKNNLNRLYDIPIGKVQLVRVPYYQNVNIASTLSCLPWDGAKGGIVIFISQDSIILNADIDVSGKGFRGGIDPISTQGSYNCYENQYFYAPNLDLSSEKGEGIAMISISKSYGKGALANGGGSGSSHNSGGAGGGLAGIGGRGGYNYEGPPCNVTIPFDNGGIGGRALAFNNIANKIFLGGGGGAGQTNTGIFQANGGAGGGMVIIIANKLKTNANKIKANGGNAPGCGSTGPDCHEGMGGGGSGGIVLAQINNYIDNTSVEVKGGKGGDMIAVNLDRIGPGGGGGGGITWFTNSILPANVAVAYNGGINGVCPDHSNDPWGALPGSPGSTLFDLVIPFDNILFKPNIDSVRFQNNPISCGNFDFTGMGYSNTSPIVSWYWDFGDGGNASTQNASHVFLSGTYNIKLIVTDINGCKDSLTKPLIVNSTPTFANISISICEGQSYNGHTTPGIYLDHFINSAGCDSTLTLNLTVKPNSFFSTSVSICEGQSYNGHTISGVYTDHFTNSVGCDSTLTLTLTVKPKANTTITTSVCEGQNVEGYTTSGVYVNTFVAANGCDSIRTLNLTVTPAKRTTVNAAICQGQNYFAGGSFQTVAGTYTDMLLTAAGCDSIVTTQLTVRPNPQPDLGSDKIICTASTSLLLNGGVYAGYLWSDMSAQPDLTVTAPGIYWLTVTDANNCRGTDTIKILLGTSPLIRARKTNDIDCALGQATLIASGGRSYTWSPALTLSNPGSSSTIASPLVTTKYYVTGIDVNGCTNSDSVTVTVSKTDNKTGYAMPSGFTPNNDGINDCFGIKYWGNILELEFSVFNRWGQLVFYSTQPGDCWDGTFKGIQQDANVFVYMITAKTSCEGKIFRKGTFALIR